MKIRCEPLTKKQKETINQIVEKEKFVLLDYDNGKLFHIVNYHRYQTHDLKKAKRVFLCPARLPEGQLYLNRYWYIATKL